MAQLIAFCSNNKMTFVSVDTRCVVYLELKRATEEYKKVNIKDD